MCSSITGRKGGEIVKMPGKIMVSAVSASTHAGNAAAAHLAMCIKCAEIVLNNSCQERTDDGERCFFRCACVCARTGNVTLFGDRHSRRAGNPVSRPGGARRRAS